MKPYRDAFGNPLTKQDVSLAVQGAVMNDSVTNMRLSRQTGLGLMKITRILSVLEQAHIVGPSKDGARPVIMRGIKNFEAARNAALRQLKKGKGA